MWAFVEKNYLLEGTIGFRRASMLKPSVLALLSASAFI